MISLIKQTLKIVIYKTLEHVKKKKVIFQGSAMEAYIGAEIQLHSLTLVLYGGKCLTPGTGRFIPRKEPGRGKSPIMGRFFIKCYKT
jgi:hypothetical protein